MSIFALFQRWARNHENVWNHATICCFCWAVGSGNHPWLGSNQPGTIARILCQINILGLSHAWISEKLPASSQLNHYDPWISLDINSLDCWKPIWFNSILKTRICRPKTFSHTTLQQKAGVFMSPCLAYLLSILKTPTIWHWTRRARAKKFATTWSGRTTWWICKNNPPVGKCGRESCHGIMFNINIYIYIRLTICNIGSCVFRK